MSLPTGKERIAVLVIVFVALASIGAFIFLTFFNNKQELNHVSTVPVDEKLEVTSKISTDVLAVESLSQYLEKTQEYDLNNIQGTPNKDMFPDIEDPKFKLVSKEERVKSSDTVASFHIGDDYRAYPLKYILYHHLVNDKFGKTPVLISYCGICNSAAAYNPIVGGKTLSFGVLGVLYHNDLVMYDKNTDSWWIQITGGAISGKHKGAKLDLLPGLEIVKFSDFKKSHPKGKVLQPIAQYESFYNQINLDKFYDQEDSLGSKDQVVGLEVRGEAKAYKLEGVKKEKVINDTLNGWSLLVVSDPEDKGVRIFRRFLKDQELVLEFELKGNTLVDKETNSRWNFNGEAIEGKLQGAVLEKPKYLELYLFAWEGFYPKTKIFKI